MQQTQISSRDSHGCLAHFCISYNTSRIPADVLSAIEKLTPGSEKRDHCPCCNAQRKPGIDSPFHCTRTVFVSTAHVDLGLRGHFVFDPCWNRCCNDACKRGWQAYQTQACKFCMSRRIEDGDNRHAGNRDETGAKKAKIYCFAHGMQSRSVEGFCCKQGEENFKHKAKHHKQPQAGSSVPLESRETLLSPRRSLQYAREDGEMTSSPIEFSKERFELKFLTLPGQTM